MGEPNCQIKNDALIVCGLLEMNEQIEEKIVCGKQEPCHCLFLPLWLTSLFQAVGIYFTPILDWAKIGKVHFLFSSRRTNNFPIKHMYLQYSYDYTSSWNARLRFGHWKDLMEIYLTPDLNRSWVPVCNQITNRPLHHLKWCNKGSECWIWMWTE